MLGVMGEGRERQLECLKKMSLFLLSLLLFFVLHFLVLHLFKVSCLQIALAYIWPALPRGIIKNGERRQTASKQMN